MSGTYHRHAGFELPDDLHGGNGGRTGGCHPGGHDCHSGRRRRDCSGRSGQPGDVQAGLNGRRRLCHDFWNRLSPLSVFRLSGRVSEKYHDPAQAEVEIHRQQADSFRISESDISSSERRSELPPESAVEGPGSLGAAVRISFLSDVDLACHHGLWGNDHYGQCLYPQHCGGSPDSSIHVQRPFDAPSLGSYGAF